MHQRRRIVLLFGFGIVLPSLLLGYLAFRGIQNDRALVEKERLEAIQKASDKVVRSVDDAITAVEEALSEAAANGSGSRAPGTPAALERFLAGNPLVEQLFRFQPPNEILFPLERPLYAPDGSREAVPPPAGEPRRQAEFLAAQILEFRDNDLPGALAAYRRVRGRTRDARLSAMILNAMARVQKKSGLSREAVSTYETVVEDHGRVVIPGGMPLGPPAALEICGLTRELGDLARSLRMGIALYRSLVRREWDLEKAEFDLFAGRAKDHVEALLANPPAEFDVQALRTEFGALEKEGIEARRRTERALVFQERAAPALETRLRVLFERQAPGPWFVRGALEIGGESFLVSIGFPRARDSGDRGGASPAWGLVLDAATFREDVLRPALLSAFSSGETAWIVRARDGSAMMSSELPVAGPAALRVDFASNFPDWTLEVNQAPAHLIKSFLVSRRGLYSLVFLLLAGILVFGLVLTMRSVSHELELARMKSDFVSTVSHEFKSPLTSIRQISEMLQSGRVPSEGRRRRYYDVLLEQSERLALLTDNILGLAKIEEGRSGFTLEPTDLASLLNDVVTSIRERVSHEGFEIGLEVGATLPPMALDRTALSQALTNLIDNAVKYSGDSRTIDVRAAADGGEIAIAVRDYGIGIKKEDVPKLFERFYRSGDELTRTVKGSGLGLTLVKEIVEAHGGRIHVESEPGKGSVFTIRLPLPRREES